MKKRKTLFVARVLLQYTLLISNSKVQLSKLRRKRACNLQIFSLAGPARILMGYSSGNISHKDIPLATANDDDMPASTSGRIRTLSSTVAEAPSDMFNRDLVALTCGIHTNYLSVPLQNILSARSIQRYQMQSTVKIPAPLLNPTLCFNAAN